jgi:hypothetical protein
VGAPRLECRSLDVGPERERHPGPRPVPGDRVQDVGVAAERLEPVALVGVQRALDRRRGPRRRVTHRRQRHEGRQGAAVRGFAVAAVEVSERRLDRLAVAREVRVDERRAGEAVHAVVGRDGDAVPALQIGGPEQRPRGHLAGGDHARECERRVDGVGRQVAGHVGGCDRQRRRLEDDVRCGRGRAGRVADGHRAVGVGRRRPGDGRVARLVGRPEGVERPGE